MGQPPVGGIFSIESLIDPYLFVMGVAKTGESDDVLEPLSDSLVSDSELMLVIRWRNMTNDIG